MTSPATALGHCGGTYCCPSMRSDSRNLFCQGGAKGHSIANITERPAPGTNTVALLLQSSRSLSPGPRGSHPPLRDAADIWKVSLSLVHGWFSGRSLACHAGGPGCFPGPCSHSVPFWGASVIALLVKNLPAMQETPFRSLGWEDPLEKGKATHSSILAWGIPCTV